jgi:anti-anti-sigma factor
VYFEAARRSGRLAPALSTALGLERAGDQRPDHHIVLDLRGMILIDSAGVEVLARLSAWTRDNGGDLVLRSASPDLAEQLELARRAEAHRRHPSTGS